MNYYFSILFITFLGNEQYGITKGTDFADALAEAIHAINHGIYPERITQGSSGSYFVKNLKKVFTLIQINLSNLGKNCCF